MDHDNHLHRMNRMLTGLSRVNQIMLRVREDRSRLLREAGRIIHEHFLYELVWLGEINSRGEVLYGTSEGELPGEAFASIAASAQTTAPPISADSIFAVLRNVAIRAATENQAIIAEPIAAGRPDCASPDWLISAIPVPIDADTSFVLLAVAHPDRGFPPEEVNILVEMAGDLGLVLEALETRNRTESAEQALRTSEERFRRLSESSLVGIVLIQNGVYRYVNPAFAEMFGYRSPREIIDKLGPLDLTAPDSREVVNANIQRRILGQIRAVRYQYHGLRKDGTVFDVEEHGARTVHAQRLAIVATVLDVTAREASQRRIEALSRAGLVLSQAQTPEQAINRAVEQVATILRCDSATIVTFRGHSHQPEVVVSHPPGTGNIGTMATSGAWPATEDGLPSMLMTQESTVVSEAIRDAADSDTPTYSYAAAPLVVRGELIGLLVVEAEQVGMFTSEDARHLRLFADHVAATLQHLRLISSLEAESNRLQTVNELSRILSETLRLQEVATRALRKIGTAIGANVSVLYLWDGKCETLSAVAAEGLSLSVLPELTAALAGVKTGEAKQAPEVVESCFVGDATDETSLHRKCLGIISGKGGIEFDQIACAMDIRLESHGEFVGVLSFLTDSMGFGAPDAELAKALGVPVALAIQNAQFYERAARQADMMAEALHRQEELDHMKDELIQNVSHELRTPLSLVMGYAEILQSGDLGLLTPDQTEAVGVITRRSKMLCGLVEDIALLWNLERQTDGLDYVDLRELVTDTVLEFQARADDSGLTLDAQVPEEAVKIRAVPLHMRRILDNLIGNSLKFTPHGGSIAVTLEVVKGRAVMSVSDTGIGVPQEKLQRIFERFYQVDGSARRQYGGTGLGLALVKAIVEKHGGTIAAESPVTGDPARPGTRLTVSLPMAEA